MVCGCVPNPFTSTAENEVWDPDASGTKLACVLSSAGPPTCGPGLVSGGLWPCSSRLWSGIRRRLRLGACVVSTPINTGSCSSMPVPCEVRSEKKRIWPAERVPADFLMVLLALIQNPSLKFLLVPSVVFFSSSEFDRSVNCDVFLVDLVLCLFLGRDYDMMQQNKLIR